MAKLNLNQQQQHLIYSLNALSNDIFEDAGHFDDAVVTLKNLQDIFGVDKFQNTFIILNGSDVNDEFKHYSQYDLDYGYQDNRFDNALDCQAMFLDNENEDNNALYSVINQLLDLVLNNDSKIIEADNYLSKTQWAIINTNKSILALIHNITDVAVI